MQSRSTTYGKRKFSITMWKTRLLQIVPPWTFRWWFRNTPALWNFAVGGQQRETELQSITNPGKSGNQGKTGNLPAFCLLPPTLLLSMTDPLTSTLVFRTTTTPWRSSCRWTTTGRGRTCCTNRSSRPLIASTGNPARSNSRSVCMKSRSESGHGETDSGQGQTESG